MIAWVERDDAHTAERMDIVLVAERRNGISDVLSLANIRRDSGGRLTVDGPSYNLKYNGLPKKILDKNVKYY